LGSGDVALMLRDILDIDPDDDVLAMVARASGGNPFVVEELVRDAVARGRLDHLEGTWRLDEPLELPARVQGMVQRRVRGLSAGDQELLRWAAVLGERFDPRLLASVSGVGEHLAIAAIGRMRRAGLVADEAASGDGHLALRHTLTREAVLA